MRHRQPQEEVGGGGKAHAAAGRSGRWREGTGSHREMWEAEGRHRQLQGEGMHRQPQGEVGGGGKAQARGERRSVGICSDRE